MTSPEIIRKNVVMNGPRWPGFRAQNGDTAGLVNTATQTSMAKCGRLRRPVRPSRCKHAAGIVCWAMTMALFRADCAGCAFPRPDHYQRHIYTIAYLQMWPILFSILNHAMNFTAANSNEPRDAATFDQSAEYLFRYWHHSWLAGAVHPVYRPGMVKGLGQVVSQAGN